MKLFNLAMCLAISSPAASIWMEGEAAIEKRVTRHGWYDGQVKKDILSGGEWISHFDASQPGLVRYEFQVLTEDRYTLWLRANPVQAKLEYQLNGQGWQSVQFSDARERLNIAADNKPDLRFLAWVRVGQVSLRPGSNRLAFRITSRAQNHGAIDCFCLTTDSWVPSGSRRPTGPLPPAAPDEWFPVVFDDDPLSPESVIDMSRFVEAPAGERGFLKREGADLRFAKSDRPIKFWGIGSSPGNMDEAQMVQAARWYRKHGINLVRQHTVVEAVGLLNSQGQFDPNLLDRYDRWFATLKAQGIYSTWSVIYPHHGAILQKQDGYDPTLFSELDRADRNHDGNRQAIVVNDFINLDPNLQDILFRYFQTLLNHTNSYTGLRYRDDPALAFLEFQNESNLYFHTLNGLRSGEFPLFAKKLRRAFFQFIRKKYQTKEAVATAWINRWDRDDNWEEGELGLMGAFHWGSDGPLHEFAGQPRRAGDYIAFLTHLQRDYYERRQIEVRQAGFQGVTVTTAWRSGGPAASLANLYADTAADLIDRHNYMGGGEGGHRIVEGKVSTETHLNRPGRGLLNLGLFQVEDRPFAVSEWSMMPPAPFKAEAAPLYAFYGMGLQGWDAVYHFSCGASRMGEGWPNQSKYVTHTPHYMGQFPALALAVHQGHLHEGKVVAAQRVSDLFSGRDLLGQALSEGSHDVKEFGDRSLTPSEALAVGRVTVGFSTEPSQLADLAPYWDRSKQVLRSTTDELEWHYGEKVVEIRSQKTQGIIGFAQNRIINLPSVVVQLKTPFVSLLFSPLDGQPLTASSHVLITAMARDKQTGAEYSEDWSQLRTLGGPPLLMEPVQARIRFAGAKPSQVRPLDVYGVPCPKNLIVDEDGGFQIDGTYRTYYYEVRR